MAALALPHCIQNFATVSEFTLNPPVVTHSCHMFESLFAHMAMAAAAHIVSMRLCVAVGHRSKLSCAHAVCCEAGSSAQIS